MSGIFGNLRMIVFIFLKLLGSMVFPKITYKVGPFSAENSRTLHGVLGQIITVRMMLLLSQYGIPSQDSKKV